LLSYNKISPRSTANFVFLKNLHFAQNATYRMISAARRKIQIVDKGIRLCRRGGRQKSGFAAFLRGFSLRCSHDLSTKRGQIVRMLRARCFSDAHVVRKRDPALSRLWARNPAGPVYNLNIERGAKKCLTDGEKQSTMQQVTNCNRFVRERRERFSRGAAEAKTMTFVRNESI
jgi:hypothetical protein